MTDKEPEWVIVRRATLAEIAEYRHGTLSPLRAIQTMKNTVSGLLAAASQSNMVPVPRDFLEGLLRKYERLMVPAISALEAERLRALLTRGSGSAAEGGEGR